MKKNELIVWNYLSQFSHDLGVTYKTLVKETGLTSDQIILSIENLKYNSFLKVIHKGRNIYLLNRHKDTDNFYKLRGSKKEVTLSDILVINEHNDSVSKHDFRVIDFPW